MSRKIGERGLAQRAQLARGCYPSFMLVKVTDYQDRGPAGVQSRTVFVNPDYVVAMEPWGHKYKVFVGRSLEYVVSPDDVARLAELGAGSAPAASGAL